jgi:hypothetical protein
MHKITKLTNYKGREVTVAQMLLWEQHQAAMNGNSQSSIISQKVGETNTGTDPLEHTAMNNRRKAHFIMLYMHVITGNGVRAYTGVYL